MQLYATPALRYGAAPTPSSPAAATTPARPASTPPSPAAAPASTLRFGSSGDEKLAMFALITMPVWGPIYLASIPVYKTGHAIQDARQLHRFKADWKQLDTLETKEAFIREHFQRIGYLSPTYQRAQSWLARQIATLPLDDTAKMTLIADLLEDTNINYGWGGSSDKQLSPHMRALQTAVDSLAQPENRALMSPLSQARTRLLHSRWAEVLRALPDESARAAFLRAAVEADLSDGKENYRFGSLPFSVRQDRERRAQWFAQLLENEPLSDRERVEVLIGLIQWLPKAALQFGYSSGDVPVQTIVPAEVAKLADSPAKRLLADFLVLDQPEGNQPEEDRRAVYRLRSERLKERDAHLTAIRASLDDAPAAG